MNNSTIITPKDVLALERTGRRRGFIAGILVSSFVRYLFTEKRSEITNVTNNVVAKAHDILGDDAKKSSIE